VIACDGEEEDLVDDGKLLLARTRRCRRYSGDGEKIVSWCASCSGGGMCGAKRL